MKKIFVFLCIGIVGFIILSGDFGVKDECIRIHIRANSNTNIDQTVKYEVRDAVVEYLTPVVSEIDSFSDAKSAVQKRLQEVERVAEKVLQRKGYSYGATAKLKRENFPARSYEGYTLEEGVYDALIIELGEGTGNNWWCVLFPPLCFTPKGEGDTIEYRSKLAELCEKIFG